MQSPAAVYEKCPKHPQNDIILFCLGGQCIEECCKTHIQWHNENNQRPEIDTVDNVRQGCLKDVHQLKERFEEERAILKHFSDGDHSELIKTAHQKLEQAKQKLMQMVNEYCASLEVQIKNKILQHRSAHPGEKKDLHNKLNKVITDLDVQEKGLLQPRYMRQLLIILTEERHHDLEGMANEIDRAVKHYLENMFDIFIHDDKLIKLRNDLEQYVQIEEAQLDKEIEIFQQQLRQGKKVYGMDKFGNPTSEGIGGRQQQPVSFGLSNKVSPQKYGYESKIESNNEKLKSRYYDL